MNIKTNVSVSLGFDEGGEDCVVLTLFEQGPYTPTNVVAQEYLNSKIVTSAHTVARARAMAKKYKADTIVISLPNESQ